MARPPKRPDPIEHSPLRLTAVRHRRRGVDLEWYWRAREQGGERRQAAIGWVRAGDVEELRRRAGELLAAGGPTSSRSADRRRIETVAELLEAWIERKEGDPTLRPNTVRLYRYSVRHLKAWVGEVQVGRVRPDTLEQYRADRLKEGGAPRTVWQELVAFRAAWRWGWGAGHVAEARLQLPGKAPRTHVRNRRTPEVGEVAQVLEQLAGEAAIVVRLLEVTGARAGEVLGLQRGDLDLARRVVTLRGKTGTREFPWPAGELVELEERAAAGPPDAPMVQCTPQRLRLELRAACAAAKVPVFTPHGIRRLAATRLRQQGVAVETAARLLGHSPAQLLDVYRQVSDEEKRRAAATLRGVRKGKVIEFSNG